MADGDFNKYFNIALSEESLKNVLKRDSLAAQFKIEDLDTDEEIINFEEALVEAYNDVDKYKVYHVALFDESKLQSTIESINQKLEKKSKQIFTQPYVERGLYKILPNLTDNEYSFGILLFKDKIKPIRDVNGLIINEEIYKILYMYRIDIFKLSEAKKCLIISFPTYTERKGTTHYFNEEIQFVYNMFEGYGLSLEPFNVKEFFNKLPEGTKLLTQGFYGRSVTGNDERDLPIEVKYKRDSANNYAYQEFFRLIDTNICSEISTLINTKLIDKGLILEEKGKECEACISKELKEFEISESIVDEIKNYSKDGSGWIYYRQDNNESVNIFSIIYNKMNKLQFRSTYEKWDRFKPLYDEIKKYIIQAEDT